MPKFDIKKLSTDQQRILLERFFLAVASLKHYNEVRDFFKDLLDPQETAMLARRLKIAELLDQDLTYEEIALRLHTGKDTIARVGKWFYNGHGGYQLLVKRLKDYDKKRRRS
ncbi:MAG: YerC/YecD family TrpR-related protein [Patescibacteria group bacterium]